MDASRGAGLLTWVSQFSLSHRFPFSQRCVEASDGFTIRETQIGHLPGIEVHDVPGFSPKPPSSDRAPHEADAH